MNSFIRKAALVLALALAFTSCLSACFAEQSLADAIGGRNKIALFVPLTGEQKQYGEAISNGLKMQVEEFNKANGTNIAVDVYDDKGDSTEAANIAYKIISDGSVFCAMGSYSSSCVLAAAPIFQESGLLFLSPGASHPDVPKVGDHIFTYGINIVKEMEATMRELSARFENAPLAIIYQATDHGVKTLETTQTFYPSLGGTVVAAETFVPDTTTDFKSIISKVKEAGAEIVFLSTTYADGAQIILQAADLDTNFRWVGNSQLMQEEFMNLVGNLGEGLFASSNMPVYLKSTLDNEGARASLGEEQIEFIGRYIEFCG
ncbi:MAG: ABC transporter substrate-binding protein, partial [Clostridiales bacterium]|nr:ABC transporter substrate-binding protein [Clostridiales bacterium]